MASQSTRINRYLSEAGLGSRRECESLVLEGRVQVNGERIEDLATRVEEGSVVRVDGKTVHTARQTVVIALNKPRRVLSSTTDPENRALAIDLVKPLYGGRLFSVGRLDYLSSGLILFTNDGDLAQRLMRPATRVEREYVVETRDAVNDETLHRLRQGIRVGRERYRIQSFRRHTRRRVTLVLTEGKNREIRHMLESENVPVTRIYRTRYGSVTLGSLAPGQARFLSQEEIQRLRTEMDQSQRRLSNQTSPGPRERTRERSRSGEHGSRGPKTSNRGRPHGRRD